MNDGALIECTNVSCGYGDVPVVNDTTFSVCRGEIVAVAGRNGSGKTTILRLLAGQLAPLSGRVNVLNVRPHRRPTYQMVRKGLVLVNERRDVFPNLTVASNLAISRRLSKSFQLQRDLIDSLVPQLKDKMAVTAGSLSGGERSLLAYVNGLTLAPRLLLVDELSEGLQPIALERVLATIRALVKQEGMAVIFVEQVPRVIAQFASRVLAIQEGHVVELRDVNTKLLQEYQ